MHNIGINKAFLVARMNNGFCFYCDDPSEVVDHFISKKKYRKDYEYVQESGSADQLGNLVPACRKCNAHKGTRAAWQFIQTIIPELEDQAARDYAVFRLVQVNPYF